MKAGAMVRPCELSQPFAVATIIEPEANSDGERPFLLHCLKVSLASACVFAGEGSLLLQEGWEAGNLLRPATLGWGLPVFSLFRNKIILFPTWQFPLILKTGKL